MTELTEIRFSRNQISDLTPLAGLTKLETLQLISNQITDLTPLAGLTNLTTLAIDNNDIGGEENLQVLINLKNLVSLTLSGTSFTSEELERLHEAHPNCVIIDDSVTEASTQPAA